MLRAFVLAITMLSALGACGTVARDRSEIEALHASITAPEAVPDLGKRAYVLAVLRRGAAYGDDDAAARRDLLVAHTSYLASLTQAGALVLSGPCGPQSSEDPYEGFLLFACELEQARALAEADPVVQAGRLRVELVPWWAPVGISVREP